jgi:hypothetical protein
MDARAVVGSQLLRRVAGCAVALALAAPPMSARGDAATEVEVAPGQADRAARRAARPQLERGVALAKRGELRSAAALLIPLAAAVPSAEHDCHAAAILRLLDRLDEAMFWLDQARGRRGGAPSWCAELRRELEPEVWKRGMTPIAIALEPPEAMLRVFAEPPLRLRGAPPRLWHSATAPLSVQVSAPGYRSATVELPVAQRYAIELHPQPPPTEAEAEAAPPTAAGDLAPSSTATAARAATTSRRRAASAAVAATAAAPQPAAAPRRTGPLLLLGAGVVTAAVGGWFGYRALQLQRDGDALLSSDPELPELQRRFRLARGAAIGSCAAAAVLGVAAAAWWRRRTRAASTVALVRAAGGGYALTWTLAR